MIKMVTKRDGRVVPFDENKIMLAIGLSLKNTDLSELDIETAIHEIYYEVITVLSNISDVSDTINVEDIQDIIVASMKNLGYDKSAKSFTAYRNKRTKVRERKTSLMKQIAEMANASAAESDGKRENANIDGDTAMGTMLKFGTTTSKEYYLREVIPEDASNLHRTGYIHIHDMDFYSLTTTCLTPDTKILLKVNDSYIYTTFAYFDDYFNTTEDSLEYLNNIEIFNNGSFTPVKWVSRRRIKENEIVYNVSNKFDTITMTESHQVPVIRNNEQILINAKDIRIGDRMIYTAKMPSLLDEINCIDLFKDMDLIVIKNTTLLRKLAHDHKFIEKFYKCLDCPNTSTKYLKPISLREYLRVRHLFVDILDEHDLKLDVRQGHSSGYSAYIKLDSNLGKFIGYVYSEGCCCTVSKQQGVTFTNRNTSMLDEFAHLSEVLFNIIPRKYQKDSCWDLQIGKAYIAQLFNGPFGIKENSYNIVIPNWMYFANYDFLDGFISGLIDGDGSVSSPFDNIRYGTSCKHFAEHLHELLYLHGINSVMSEKLCEGEEKWFGNVLSISKSNHYTLDICGYYIDDLNLTKSILYNNNKRNVKRVPQKTIQNLCINNISSVDYDGFVYDIETESHYFTANSFVVHNCLQAPLAKLLNNGFSTGHGHLRTPNGINTAAALTCIVIQSNQNDQHGGQSIPKFDYDLAPYVAKTFITNICEYLDDNEVNEKVVNNIREQIELIHEKSNSLMHENTLKIIEDIIQESVNDDSIVPSNCINKAIKKTDRATYQAMEALIHNLNTMNCLPSYERIWVIDTAYRSGELKLLSMQEIYDTFKPNKYLALSYNKVDDIFEWKPIINCINNGKRDNLVMTTCIKGMSIATTDNHRFLVRSEDDLVVESYPKEISEILIAKGVEGYMTLPAVSLDHYHSRKKQNYVDDHIPLTENFAELLGYYVADGSVVGGSQLSFGVCDYNLSLRIKDLMMEIYGKDISYKDIYRHDKYIETRFNVGKVWSECFKDICGSNAHTKKIPSIILQNYNLDYLKKFLYGYLYCDARCDRFIEVSTVSYELSRDLLFACYRLGEIPYIKEVTKSTSYSKSGIYHGYTLLIGNKAIQRIGLKELLTHEATFEIRKDNKIQKNLFAVDSQYVEMPYDGSVFDITVADNENFVTADGVLVHNSRAGAQVPFSSINFGTDTSREGRMIIKNFLLAQDAGLGAGETPIFPISIFKTVEGINYNPEDPNYDLFKLACRVSAKRLFPNFSFPLSPFNAPFYKEDNPDTEIAYMGCVKGTERVSVQYNNKTYYIDFERLHNIIKNELIPISYSSKSEYYDTDNKLRVYDSSVGHYVNCKKFIINHNVTNWLEIIFSNGFKFTCTTDHPLPVFVDDYRSIRTYASDIKVGDRIALSKLTLTGNNNFITVSQIMPIDYIADSYDVETDTDRFDVSGICSHNCRTRVISDITDPDNQIVTGRGNLSFTSINLPRLAIEAEGDINKFYQSLDKIMEIVKNQLLHRYKIQCNKTIKNYPFLMGQGAWIHSDELGINDNLEPALKHGTLSIGFIGLAETLKSLIGKHHGESETAQKLGLEIIKHMRDYTDRVSTEYNLNFSLLATPAEGLSGRFVKMDRIKFGKIEGVTDRDYYTNSTHVPVYYPISAYKKIQIEAPYQALCNAGHICYVELDGDPTENMEAFESVIRCMHDEGIGYGAVNHPVDRDPVCGYVGIIGDVCPCCGRHEGEALTPEAYRNIIAKNRLGGIYGK